MATNLKNNLMITSQVAVGKTIMSVLDRFSIKIDTSYDALSSVSVIKDAYNRTGNTVFIRKAFARYLAEHGAPFLLIIDYRIFLTQNLEEDADMRKILRTLLLSYMIFNRDIDVPRCANIVLIDVGENGSGAGEIEDNPLILLEMLKTENNEINALIQSYKKDLGKFIKQFNIISLSPKDDPSFTSSKLEKHIQHIQAFAGKEPAINNSLFDTDQVIKPVMKTMTAPIECHVVVRIDDNSLLIDGKQCNPAEEGRYSDLENKGINIIGHWNKGNQRDVTESLLRTFTKGTSLKIFRKTDEIVINLSRNCIIDSLIISSLFTLVNHDLKDYPKLKIIVDFKNGVKLENAPGYLMIKDRVYHVF